MFFRKKTQSVEWLIVFLGNPGPKYASTRHNVGFMTGDKLASKLGVSVNRAKFRALTCKCSIDSVPVLLLKPQTYMNLSGSAVRQAMDFYKVPLDHILVVSDDVSLPEGKLRIRRSGSAGGHNGLKDIIEKCGGEGFPRVRVGVGGPEYDMVDWVLGTFKNEHADIMDNALDMAADAVQCVVTEGVEKAMSLYN